MERKKAIPQDKKIVFPQEKSGLHARNRHRSRYDFPALIASSPELGAFVAENKWGDLSIDFADPQAVKALNRALLRHFYQIENWDIPADYLCPPIPGRADYVHHLADVLADSNGGVIPQGKNVAILDIGVGANCIYPIVGLREYGWRFTASEIDEVSMAAAKKIVATNPVLTNQVRFRLQAKPPRIFDTIIRHDERYDAVLCNPPFHASAAEAAAGSQRDDQIDNGNSTPDLHCAEITGNNFLTLTCKFRYADNDKQRSIFDTDDPLVTQRWQHAAQSQRHDDVTQCCTTGKSQRQARFVEASIDRLHRTTRDFRDIGTGVDNNGDHGRGKRIDSQTAYHHRQGKIDKHHLDNDWSATNQLNEYQSDITADNAAKRAREARDDANDNAPN